MLHINVQSPDILRRNTIIANALNQIRGRSFSGRHPELGKMLNCPVCDRRHRQPRCEPVYAVYPEDHELAGQERVIEHIPLKMRIAQIAGSKYRIRPHYSKQQLQLVDLTQILYPLNAPFISDPTECMKEARKQAGRMLKEFRQTKRLRSRAQTKLSRRINHLLLKGTGVLRWGRGTAPNSETRSKRIERQIRVTRERREAANGSA